MYIRSLLLLPALALHPNPTIATCWFATTATLMLPEHLRRTKLLGLGRIPTLTWVAYRLAILLLVLIFP